MGLANEQPRNDLEMKNIQQEVDKLTEEHERSIHDGKKLQWVQKIRSDCEIWYFWGFWSEISGRKIEILKQNIF